MSLELERTRATEVFDDYARYRALNTLAVVSGVLGLLSLLAFFDWILAIIPLVGIFTGFLALRRIRANPEDYTGELIALAGSLLSALFLLGGLSWQAYDHLTEVPEGYRRINYDLLQPAAEAPYQIPPQRALELDGQKIFVKGYVYQPDKGRITGIKQFILVRDKGDCCFGGSPRITDMIMVRLKGKLEATFDMRVRRLGGTLHVESDAGMHGLGGVIYQLDADYLR
ncbi:MAG TPA: DUF4190 domain-containing protein [Pirellulales bacterium]|nr:DUF4190 domain-containing protein [Pirellulales bacterium]